MILQLLVSRLVLDVRHSCCCFHTIAWLLVIHVLERVSVKVYRSGSIGLRSCLMIHPVQLIRQTFESLTDFLSCQKFINSTPVMG